MSEFTRPTSIIHAEIEVTRLARQVCRSMTKYALDQRLILLREGWPVGHAMCKALDEAAAMWAAQEAAQGKAYSDLVAEVDHIKKDNQSKGKANADS